MRWIGSKKYGRLLAAVAAVGLVAPLTSGGAQAAPTCTSTVDLGPTFSGFVNFSAVTTGVCVLAQDKLYGNFNLGNLPTSGILAFQFTVVGATEHHQLSFNANYLSGTTYTFGYEIAVTDPTTRAIDLLDSDFTQTTGTSTLTKNTTPTGGPPTGITLTKTGPIPNPGSVTEIAYDPGVSGLIITETLVDAGTVSSITNTVVQGIIATPEPTSAALLGLGILGLGWLHRRRA